MAHFPHIRLFGFEFQWQINKYWLSKQPSYIAGTPTIDIEPLSAPSKNIRINKFKFTTKSGVTFLFQSSFSLKFELQHSIATPLQAPSNASVLFELRTRSTNSNAIGIDLDIGPLKIYDTHCYVDIHKGKDGYRDLWIKPHRTHYLLESDSLPISIKSNKNAFWRPFHQEDASDFTLETKDNPFTLQTKLGHNPSIVKRWQILNQTFNVGQLSTQTSLLFIEDKRDSSPLYLHPFQLNQNSLASIGLDTKAINLKLVRGNDSNKPLLVQVLEAIPKPSGYLHTYGLTANTPAGYHRWKVIKNHVTLAVRSKENLTDSHGLLLLGADTVEVSSIDTDTHILGLRREVKLKADNAGSLKSEMAIAQSNRHQQISEDITKKVTTPYFEIPLDKLKINRPGITLTTESNEVKSWDFTASGSNPIVSIPICPDEAIPNDTALMALHKHCNQSYLSLTSDNAKVTHSSALVISGTDEDTVPVIKPSLHKLFQTSKYASLSALEINGAKESSALAAPGLGEHLSHYDFGNYVVVKEWSESDIPEYVPLIVDEAGKFDESTNAHFANATGFSMDPEYKDKEQDIRVNKLTTIHQNPDTLQNEAGLKLQVSDKRLIGIVKLGKEFSIEQILEKEKIDQTEYNNINKELSSNLGSKSWMGLILFEQNLDLSKFTLLESLVPNGALKLRYLALSPNREQNFSTYGLIKWKNPYLNDIPVVPSVDSSQELNVQMAKVDISWAARKLVSFRSETRIQFRSFAGARKSADLNDLYTRIDIIGGINKDTGVISFLAQAQKPLKLLKDEGLGPLKQVYLKQIEVIRSRGRTEFLVDGRVELKALSLSEMWSFEQGDKVKFDGLKFWFDDRLNEIGDWLKFDYPSLQFEFAKGWNLLSLDGINIDIRRIGFDQKPDSFDWGELITLKFPHWGDKVKSLRFGIQLNLGKMPFLSQNPFEELIFDFEIAIPYDEDFLNIHLSNARFGLRALGFSKLNLKLMRFLEITADSVFLKKEAGGLEPLWLFFEGLKLKILDKTLIEDFTLGHYWLDDKKGFIGLLNDDLVNLSILKIDWLLIGRNLRLNGNNNNDLVKKIVSIVPSQTSLKQDIKNAYAANALIPSSTENIGEWVFAAGFSLFNEFLIGKFLFQDNAYYGIAIKGPILKDWFGYDLAISVLYIVQERPEEDIFRLELKVPSVDLGGFSFMGGIIVIEIQMNGSFLLDMGYPWLASNGERLWERGFGVILAGLMGKGGSFIAKRSSLRSGDIFGSTPGKLTLVEGGQATMVGMGKSFRAGPLRVRAYAGIYYTCEGGILFFTPKGVTKLRLVGLRLSGSIGIQARGIAELNWWVISVRVEVVAGAEARLTLFWGALEHHQPGSSNLPTSIDGSDERVGVRVDFVLYARVSAKACIGSGWFKVCKSISIGISMPYRTTLYLS
jgi:hypothetical protein